MQKAYPVSERIYKVLHTLELTESYMKQMIYDQAKPEFINKVRQFGDGFCYLMLVVRNDGNFLIYELANHKIEERYLTDWDQLLSQWSSRISLSRSQSIDRLGPQFPFMNCFKSPKRTEETSDYASNSTDALVSLKQVSEVSFLVVPRNYSELLKKSDAHWGKMQRDNRNSGGMPTPEWKEKYPSPLKNFMTLSLEAV